ncbi:hypothetical protein WA026_022693 [Henosepilachna vigintioctopunctata]|uniref:Uncharacterized protein n=1 Tax=Henosepilachna vigintioctopunctata TaxID=420089 RepID=A0AAW1TPM0_9CUCU
MIPKHQPYSFSTIPSSLCSVCQPKQNDHLAHLLRYIFLLWRAATKYLNESVMKAIKLVFGTFCVQGGPIFYLKMLNKSNLSEQLESQ